MSTSALTSNWPRGKMVTILTRGVTGQDALGNDVYGTVRSTQVPAVLQPLQLHLAPRATRSGSFAEELEGQYIVAAGYTVFFPPGTVIGIEDQVIIDGETWRVANVPGHFQSPFTGVAGPVQVEVVRVTG